MATEEATNEGDFWDWAAEQETPTKKKKKPTKRVTKQPVPVESVSTLKAAQDKVGKAKEAAAEAAEGGLDTGDSITEALGAQQVLSEAETGLDKVKQSTTKSLGEYTFGEPTLGLLRTAFGKPDVFDPVAREKMKKHVAHATAKMTRSDTGESWADTPEGRKRMQMALSEVDKAHPERVGGVAAFQTASRGHLQPSFPALSPEVKVKGRSGTTRTKKEAQERLKKEKAALKIGEFDENNKRIVDPATGAPLKLTIDEQKEALAKMESAFIQGRRPPDTGGSLLQVIGATSSPTEDQMLAAYRALPAEEKQRYGVLNARSSSDLPWQFEGDYKKKRGLEFELKQEDFDKIRAHIQQQEKRLAAINNALVLTSE